MQFLVPQLRFLTPLYTLLSIFLTQKITTFTVINFLFNKKFNGHLWHRGTWENFQILCPYFPLKLFYLFIRCLTNKGGLKSNHEQQKQASKPRATSVTWLRATATRRGRQTN